MTAEKPTREAEGAAVSAGQRRVNLIWETTQAIVALGKAEPTR